MDLCWQSNVSASSYAVSVGHIFPFKEQAFFNFMSAVKIYSDFGAQKIKSVTLSLLTVLISRSI